VSVVSKLALRHSTHQPTANVQFARTN